MCVVVAAVIRNKKKKTTVNEIDNYDRNDSVLNSPEALVSQESNIDKGNPFIRLRNIDNVNQVWDVYLTKEVLIGRDNRCQVCLTDSSVSREQCRLYFDETAMVENLSNTNKTKLNGEPVNFPAIINIGDKLKCGRVTLIVELPYISDPNNVGGLNNGTVILKI